MINVVRTTKHAKIKKKESAKLFSLLSPYVFNTFIKASIDKLKCKTREIEINERKIHRVRFADDIVLLTTQNDMNKILNSRYI